MGAEPDRPQRAQAGYTPPAGDSASREALLRLRQELVAARATQAALPHLKRALAAIGANDHALGLKAVNKALALDPNSFFGHHLKAITLEKTDNWPGALDSYGKALELKPDSPEIANDLGRLAFRMGMLPQAETLFRYHLSQRPHAAESSNNLACVLREQMRYDEGVALLTPAIQANPDRPMLWNTLGTIMADQGECEQAAIFYTEVLRLDPKHNKARYNRSNALFTLGDTQTAIADCQAAMKAAETPQEFATMQLALSSMLLASGDLSQGWDAYESRLSPDFHDPIHFLVSRPLWTPETDICGAHLLLVGEQGLGDEIMFANMIDEVIEALGPGGRLSLAVEPRLVPFFRRSFPRAHVDRHHTFRRHGRHIRAVPWIEDWADVDCYAPLGQLLRRFRNKIEDFPERPNGYMKADPDRVAFWRAQFADRPGRKVGLLWTSMLINSSRKKYFAPFEQWGPVLTQPGATFINLQYGDRSADIEMARREFGVEILQPQDIDLKMNLDDVAALSCAMDLIVGPANATSNIAAACGVPNWLIAAPAAWPQLGTDRYPFYSQTRVFATHSFGDWSPVMAEVGEALGQFLGGEAARAKAS